MLKEGKTKIILKACQGVGGSGECGHERKEMSGLFVSVRMPILSDYRHEVQRRVWDRHYRVKITVILTLMSQRGTM